MHARIVTAFLAAGLAFGAIGAQAQMRDAIEVPPGELAAADVDFLQAADSANMDQLMLANRASSRTKRPGVHSLADNAHRAYSKADAALRLLAAKKSVDLDHHVTDRGQSDADAMLDERGQLDRIYVEGMMRDTDDIIAMYEDARDNSPDPDIRGYADTMLGALHDLDRQANDLYTRETGDDGNQHDD
jgi:putative membrane protein